MKLTNNINKVSFPDGKMYSLYWDLTSIKQLNFFIGPNNSGKSRQLRNYFRLDKKDILFDSNLFSIKQYITHLELLHQQERTSIERRFGFTLNKLIDHLSIIYNDGKTTNLKNITSNALSSAFPDSSLLQSSNQITDMLLSSFKTKNVESADFYEKISNINDWESLYIPTLRSLRHIHESDLFHSRTTTDYFKNDNKVKRIFTGHSLYDDIKAQLLGSHAQREKIRSYEKYLSINFFYGQDISLVPRIDTDVVFFKEGKKEERPIYDLGDGIQSIIILTYPVFMAPVPTMFFIEEPELYLHAGLQRTLVDTYAAHEQHMFFITTHSNHFLDIAQERDDVSIQQVFQKDNETIVQPTEKFENLLTELGVRASSVLLANCSIWVEGITDKLYLRTYLKKYIKELRESGKIERANKLSSYHENLHFVFTEYQGSNITHWYFGDSQPSENNNETPAKKLNNRILLIADADIDSKGNRVEQLNNDLGDDFILLKWKEIENYIPQQIIIQTAKARWETFKEKSDCTLELFKIRKINLFEKEKIGIGKILETYVQKPSDKQRKFFEAESGTIKDKVKFCNKAIEIMNSDDSDWKLTPELVRLCEQIWAHIEKHNI